MTALLVVLQIAGALGVFLLGMKLMSEGLQKVAGKRLKFWLGRMTSNRLSGVLTGVGITSLVQSSSATTVMVVSFVTAGLLTLTQAIGVIMGANIGTTVTGWLVALLGFKVKIAAFALPAIGIGLGMGFLRASRPKQWGEVLVGFGVLFLGLSLLKSGIPDISDPAALSWIQKMTEHGFFSLVFFVAFGTAITVVLQSSSATMTLTLTFAAMGWLPYDMAAAMVLGENIGTTATANLAAIGAPHNAQRAARAHFIFNVFGATWALALLSWVLLPIVDAIVPGNPTVNFEGLQGDSDAVTTARTVVTTHLAAFHTLFNVVNTLLLLPFVKQIERVVTRWVPEPEVPTRAPRARYISIPLIDTPELLVEQVRKEMQHMAEVARQMFSDALHILTHPHDHLGSLVEDTLEREDILDDLEREITTYLTHTTTASTSPELARTAAAMVQNTHRLERIGDHCAVLVRIAKRIHEEEEIGLSSDEVEKIATLGRLVEQALNGIGRYFLEECDPAESEAVEEQIDTVRRQLREDEIGRLREAKGDNLTTGLAVLDVLTHLEEIGDRAVGIIRLAEATKHGE